MALTPLKTEEIGWSGADRQLSLMHFTIKIDKTIKRMKYRICYLRLDCLLANNRTLSKPSKSLIDKINFNV